MLFIGCSLFFSLLKIYLFIRWGGGVFFAARELSLVVVRGGYSLIVVLGFLTAVASVPAEPGL